MSCRSTGDGIFALVRRAGRARGPSAARAVCGAADAGGAEALFGDDCATSGRLPIEARVGVNTGEVVVRSITTGEGHTEYTPIGHTDQSRLADAGARADRLDRGQRGDAQVRARATSCSSRWARRRVKGVSEPVNVYEVTGLGPLRTRLQRSAGRGLHEVRRSRARDGGDEARGRAGEVRARADRRGDGGGGHRQVAPVLRVQGQISRSGWMVLEAFSVSHGKASAYLPVIDLLQELFRDQLPRTMSASGARRSPARVLALDRSLEDTLPYLFGLLGIVEGEDSRSRRWTRRVRKRRTLEAIKRHPAAREPQPAADGDLRGPALDRRGDPGIAQSARRLDRRRRRSCCWSTIVPSTRHEWGSKTYYTQLRLDPLGRESADEMLGALLGDGEELAPLKRLIIEKTEGNPFFMEEIVQALFERGSAGAQRDAVKLTQVAERAEDPADGAGDSGRAHRPACRRRRRSCCRRWR